MSGTWSGKFILSQMTNKVNCLSGTKPPGTQPMKECIGDVISLMYY